MIELTNSAAQTVLPEQAVTFDTVMLHTGCGECFTKGIPSVELRAMRRGLIFQGNFKNWSDRR